MYQFESRIRYSETNAQGKLTLLALLDYFQDCTVFQSESIHYGIDYLRDNHRAWILASWHIVLGEQPSLGEHVRICTWPYEMKGFLGLRNFAMDNDEGEHLAWANTTWVYMDTETGKPCRVPDYVKEAYQLDAPAFDNPKRRKIPVPEKYTEAGSLTVPAFFIDTNHHMNNSRYVMVASEYLPENFRIHELQVEYRKAALLGDTIKVRTTEEDGAFTVNLTDPDGITYATVKFR